MKKRKGDPDPKKVKKLFFDLWKIFPNSTYEEKEIKKIIITQEVRDQLVKQGFLYKEAYRKGEDEGNWYGLGGNGIALVTAWETQKQNYRFNLILIFLTALLTILTVVMLWKLFNPY